MRAEIITVGAELISGSTLNTNAAYLAREVAGLGIVCARQVVVDDSLSAIQQALREALNRCELVIMTGGLGPTFDDMTMEAIGRALGRPLVFDAKTARSIRRFYSRRNRKLQKPALRQAWLAEKGKALPNPTGTAPGLWLKTGRCRLVALPGVPSEMRAIWQRSVLPRLRAEALAPIVSRTLRTIGMPELTIERVLKRLHLPQAIKVGLYPSLHRVDIRLTTTAGSRRAGLKVLLPVERKLSRALGKALYGFDDESLEEAVGRRLVALRQTVAMAESCTGGLMAKRLTDVPGSSRYVRGGVVAYHNAIKQKLLGIPQRFLASHGAVSHTVARKMAEGASLAMGATWGLSITGIAGPSGASERKPIGLVYIGLANGVKTRVWRHQLIGDRRAIRMQAAQAALNHLRLHLTRK